MSRFQKATALAAATISFAIAVPAGAASLWNGSGATDSVLLTQFGGDGASVASGTGFVSTGGITGVLTDSIGFGMQRRTNGSSWGGNFAPSAPILWNLGSGADVIFTFNSPVRGVGAQFMSDFFGAFTARITLNDGSFFDLGGFSDSSNDNSAIFIGAQNAFANITSITFHVQQGPLNDLNDFAIGDLSLLTDSGGVPEPATWALMLLGFGLIGGAMRKSKQRVRVTYA